MILMVTIKGITPHVFIACLTNIMQQLDSERRSVYRFGYRSNTGHWPEWLTDARTRWFGKNGSDTAPCVGHFLRVWGSVVDGMLRNTFRFDGNFQKMFCLDNMYKLMVQVNERFSMSEDSMATRWKTEYSAWISKDSCMQRIRVYLAVEEYQEPIPTILY